ncbi:MAG: chemotaxis protein CheW [Paucimonas sp.]|jgi:twitching motility protein PilI|nr:chemotaxis protein CheW [Paucimonas sp.]
MTQSNPAVLPEKTLSKPDAVARRTRLREFQAQLLSRMQAARSGAHVQTNQLGVMIGQMRCLLDLQQAGEIISVGPITPVPLTQDWFLGLANIRGNLISVIDFSRFLGGPTTLMDKEARIVAFAGSMGFNSALLVSRVLGLRSINEMSQAEAQASVAPWASKRFVDREENSWTEIDLSLVIQDPRFLHVGL